MVTASMAEGAYYIYCNKVFPTCTQWWNDISVYRAKTY